MGFASIRSVPSNERNGVRAVRTPRASRRSLTARRAAARCLHDVALAAAVIHPSVKTHPSAAAIHQATDSLSFRLRPGVRGASLITPSFPQLRASSPALLSLALIRSSSSGMPEVNQRKRRPSFFQGGTVASNSGRCVGGLDPVRFLALWTLSLAWPVAFSGPEKMQ